MICAIKPLADALAGTLRELGHEPVAVLAPRRAGQDEPPPIPRADRRERAGGPRSALRARQARDRAAPPRLRARPDDVLGLPLEDPAGGARRAATRLDQHAPGAAAAPPRADPARLGAARRRCRVGLDLAPDGRRARHRQPARAEDGPDRGRRRRHRGVRAASSSRRASEICRARSSVSPPATRATRSPTEGATWAGHFRTTSTPASTGRTRHGDPQPGARVAPHVRHVRGARAVAELDGEQVVLLQTRLTDPGGDARRVECGDGPIWVAQHEPV